MEQLQSFCHPEFGEVRTLLIEDIPWFVGKDVAKSLGYANTRKAILDHIDEEDKKDGVTIRDSIGRSQNAVVVNESGLYSLILSSKLPAAKQFKRWVTAEVLPSIRKHGAYLTPETLAKLLQEPENVTKLLQDLVTEHQENQQLTLEIQRLKPRAMYYENLVDTEGLENLRTTAKELGIRPMFFISYLLDRKYLYRDRNDTLHPYVKYLQMDLFSQKEFWANGHCGVQTFVTARGRNYFLTLLQQGEIMQTMFGSVGDAD